MALGETIPGFGGLCAGREATIIVLRNPSTDSFPVREVLARELPSSTSELRVALSRDVVFRRGLYTFGELHSWRRAFDSNTPDGFVFSDTDECANKVVIGVVSEAARVTAERLLRGAGAPDSAWAVVLTHHPRPGTIEIIDSLQGTVRPTTRGSGSRGAHLARKEIAWAVPWARTCGTTQTRTS